MAQDTTMNFQFTQLGVDLATKALAGTTKITFTKAVASSENHFSDTEATALALTTLGEVQQTIEIKTVMAVTDNKAQVKVPVVIDRGAITTDYSLLSIGLYAKDDDGTEVLYAVNGLQDAVEMRANAFNSTYSIDLYVAVGTSDNVTLTVDAAGMLPRTEFTAVMAEYMKIADMPKDLAYTDKANTFTEQQTLAGGAVDGTGNAIATTKNVSDGDAETLTSAKEYADTKISGKADDSKVVHTVDMRKPASDVAGIDEVSTLQTQVDNSAVGTNLLINTSISSINGRTTLQGASSVISGVYSRTNSYEQVTTSSHSELFYRFVGPDTNNLYNLTPGETYTLSGSASHTSGKLYFRAQYSTNGSDWNNLDFNTTVGNYLGIPVSDGSVFTPFSHTFTIPVGSTGVYFSLENFDFTTGSLFRFKNMKLEKGSVATDWCPNPEDKVNVSDMRKPASDVAGIEEVNAKQDKIGYTPADDSKVVHTTDMRKPASDVAGIDEMALPLLTPITGSTNFDANTYTTRGIATIGIVVGNLTNFPSGFSGGGLLQVAAYNTSGFGSQFLYDFNKNILLYRSWTTSSSIKVFTSWIKLSDDSKVAHLSGANNFDTVPTVDNNPLLLASSLPSDLARTSQQTNFTDGLQSNGQDVLTVKTPGVPNLAVKYNTTSKAFDYTLTAPEKDGFSDIIQYNLLWKDHSVDDWTTVVVNPDDLTGQITGVDSPKTYDFKAAAQNAVGSSDFTDVVTLGAVDGNIYGVSWDGSSSGALQRTDAAVGLKAGINGAQNDFDTLGPWGLMDKTITDSYGNAFVRVPKFYIRKTQNNPSSTWQVSLVKQGDDWYLPNCFYDFDNNKELDYVDVSRYEGSIASGKLQSKTGATLTENQTIVQLRSSAVANNTDGKKGYHLWDVHTLDALQVLFTIEFATLDSQSIMKGVTDSVLSGTEVAGAADGVKGSSGNVDHSNGYGSMTYRGIENLYGNLAMWTDGLNINNLSLYSCDDATKYASDMFTSPYYKLNYSLNSMDGNITGLGFDKDHPGVTAPTSVNSDSYNTDYHDYGYVNGSGNYVVYTGGRWDWHAGGSGLWFWYGYCSSTYAYSGLGSRLLKKAL